MNCPVNCKEVEDEKIASSLSLPSVKREIEGEQHSPQVAGGKREREREEKRKFPRE